MIYQVQTYHPDTGFKMSNDYDFDSHAEVEAEEFMQTAEEAESPDDVDFTGVVIIEYESGCELVVHKVYGEVDQSKIELITMPLSFIM